MAALPSRYYPDSVSFEAPDFVPRLLHLYKRDGLAVVTGVLTPDECLDTCDAMVAYIQALGTGVDASRLVDTWTDYNLPPQTRPGLFQALFSNMPAVWTIRSHPHVRRIFEVLYSHLRGKPTTEFIVSNDAVTLRPGCCAAPAATTPAKDWPHLDQTTRDDIFRCVQGQAVLTDTLASVVASPGSHRLLGGVLDACGVAADDATDWCKFNDKQVPRVQAVLRAAKEAGAHHIQWQVPIIAPPGSFIVWSSATVHSSRLSPAEERPTVDAPYLGWRAVIYVCYLPREEFSEQELEVRRAVVARNQTTDHWGTKVFPKRPGGRQLYRDKRHPRIEAMLEDPTLVYTYAAAALGAPPVLDAVQTALSGGRW